MISTQEILDFLAKDAEHIEQEMRIISDGIEMFGDTNDAFEMDQRLTSQLSYNYRLQVLIKKRWIKLPATT